MTVPGHIRNIAIAAHVNHGETTLADDPLAARARPSWTPITKARSAVPAGSPKSTL